MTGHLLGNSDILWAFVETGAIFDLTYNQRFLLAKNTGMLSKVNTNTNRLNVWMATKCNHDNHYIILTVYATPDY